MSCYNPNPKSKWENKIKTKSTVFNSNIILSIVAVVWVRIKCAFLDIESTIVITILNINNSQSPITKFSYNTSLW